MKPLAAYEIEKLVLKLNVELEGAQLQAVSCTKEWLILGFYKSSQESLLVIDTNTNSPQIIFIHNRAALPIKPITKPVGLFIKAHFLGHRVTSIEAPPDYGRVVYIHFPMNRRLEIRLFPRGQNVIAYSEGKSLSLFKPQPLKKSISATEAPTPLNSVDEDNLLITKSNEWLTEKFLNTGSGDAKSQTLDSKNEIINADSSSRSDGQLQKVSSAIAKIKLDIAAKENQPWQRAGEWLKEHLTLSVPPDLSQCIDPALSLSDNIERCFTKAKEIRRKIDRSYARIAELERSLHSISAPQIEKTKEHRLLASAEAKGRTYSLSGGITFFVGRTATDNARLLRAAKPWHLWLHLRDEPGCHGFLEINKNQKVPDNVLHEAAQRLLESQFRQKISQKQNEKFDFVVTECRFVRPIKGAKPGLVTYTQGRTFIHRCVEMQST